MFRPYFKEKVNEIANDEQFRRFTRNEARIYHILRNHISRDRFRKLFFMRTDIVRAVEKNYEMSKEYFDKANGEFQRLYQVMNDQSLGPEQRGVDFSKVLKAIEKAILLAPHERQENEMNILFNAYFLRMKVYMISNFIDNAIYDYVQAVSLCDDIGLREFEDEIDEWVPTDIREMIEDQSLKGNVDQTEYMATLSIDERCVFVSHPQRGRLMITKQDIEEGAVLTAERPQIIELEKSQMNMYCSYCFERLENGYYPCMGCIECRFCDKKCAQKAMTGFHRFECRIIGYILDNFKINWLLGYRVLTSLCNNNIIQLYNIYLRNGQGFDLSEWILHYNNQLVVKSAEEMLHQYKGLSSFVEHSSTDTYQNKIYDILDAIEIALLIEEIKVFDLTSDENLIRLVSMLIIHFNKCHANAFGWSDGQYQALVSTMINHSCVANTVIRFTEGKHTLVSLREIAAQEELSIRYGDFSFPGSANHPFIDRQKFLKHYYNFICDCEQCKLDKREVITVMKCRLCGGTVYYGDINPNRMCIGCGRVDDTNYYDNRYQNGVRVIIDAFDYFAERVNHTEESISSAEEFLQLMSERCHDSSPDLIEMRDRMDSIRGLHGMPFSQYSDRVRRAFFQ